MEEKKLGNIYGFDGGNYAGNVYDKENLSPTIRTFQGGNQQPMVISKTKCLNSKGGRAGKDGLQPSVQDRVYDIDGVSTAITSSYMPNIIEKQIVANSQGICNTLTSVQKDNLAMENIVIKTREMRIADGNICGTLTTDSCTSASHNGSYGVIEKNICINDRGFSEKEPQISIGTVPTLRAETHGNLPKVIESQYRIRKLTPLECWRLMSFSDKDFRSAEKVNSNSQLYKQAGNSIVKNILMVIFGQMIPGKENVYKD